MQTLYRGRRNILGAERANSVLAPHIDDLILSVRDGQEHYQKMPLALLAPYCRRTRANMLNDAIVDAAANRLSGRAGVVIDEDFESKFFIFDSVLATRFKKLSRNDCTRNVHTKRQNGIDFHQQELAGFQRLTFVSFGYVVNKIWTEVTELKVICRYGDETLWTIPVIAELLPSLFVSTISDDQGPSVRSAGDEEGIGGN